MGAGDYEVQGEGAERTVTGDCAGCGLVVKPGEPHRILYHPPERGGIFHAACAPTSPEWYGPERDEEIETMPIAPEFLSADQWHVDQHEWRRQHPLWRGPFTTAGEDLPVNAEAYRTDDGKLCRAHGALRRDTPILRIGVSLLAGDVAERHWVTGLVVKVRA